VLFLTTRTHDYSEISIFLISSYSFIQKKRSQEVAALFQSPKNENEEKKKSSENKKF
jgi:hypothetical protein